MIAFVETAWLARIEGQCLFRYEFPTDTFEDLNDAGMWVSQEAIEPIGVRRIDDLLAELIAQDVELKVVESLVPLKGLWGTSLHVSGIRLRNARGWNVE